MEIQDIITLDDNIDYLILDIITKKNNKYLYCAALDKEENPTSEYKYFTIITEENAEYIEEITDEALLREIITELSKHYLAMSTKEAPEN